MSEQTTHLLLVSIYVFCAFVFALLLFFFPVGGLLWVLLVLLVTLIHMLTHRDLWARERNRMRAARRRIKGKLDDKMEPKGEPAYDTSLHADHALICLTPAGEITRVLTPDLLESGLVIGRSNPDYTELTHNSSVSHNHCKITYRRHSHEYYVEDMRSRNGTFLNTKRLEPNSPEKLLEGSVISVCGVKYRFERIGEKGGQA